MPEFQKKVERRKHKRFSANDGTFAVVRSSDAPLHRIKKMSMGEIACAVYRSKPAKVGQIINLSQGGLSFSYIDRNESSSNAFEMDIIAADNSFYLDKLTFKTIMDVETSEEPSFSPITVKRQGVQFVGLTFKQLSKLEHFLRHHTRDEEVD